MDTPAAFYSLGMIARRATEREHEKLAALRARLDEAQRAGMEIEDQQQEPEAPDVELAFPPAPKPKSKPNNWKRLECFKCKGDGLHGVAMVKNEQGTWICTRNTHHTITPRHLQRSIVRAKTPASTACPRCGEEPQFLFDRPGGPFCACNRPGA